MVLKTIAKTSLIGAIGVGVSASVATNLASCAALHSVFNVSSEDHVQWLAGNSIEISAIWEGFYFNDVNNPYYTNDVIIPPEHQSDIEIITSKSGKNRIDDSTSPRQTCSLWFKVLTTCPEECNDSWYVTINWTVKFTSFKKTTKLIVNPPTGKIVINRDFNVASAPDTTGDIDIEQWMDTHTNNSLEIIDGIYNENGGTSSTEITTHLMNDIIWYQSLMLDSFMNIWIDDSLKLYASVDSTSWQCHVNLSYDPTTQVFDYFNLNIVAGSTLYLEGVPLPISPNVKINYTWGAKTSNDNDAVGGPELLGAYSLPPSPEQPPWNTHYPQGYDGKTNTSTYKPYDQKFLQFVPSTQNAYETYQLDITDTTPFPTQTSHLHVYNLTQSRFLGLEYTGGTQHIYIPTDNFYSHGHESFANMQLALPSYALNGMSYDYKNGEFFNKYPYGKTFTINPCKVNIAETEQAFVNKVSPGDKSNFAQRFLFDDWADEANYKEIPADNYIQNRLTTFQNWKDSIVPNGGWSSIKATISNDNTRDIDWWKVVQQSAEGGYGMNPANKYYGSNFASDAYFNFDDNVHTRTSINLTYPSDPNNSPFDRFGIGLNSVFEVDEQYTNADYNTCFMYPADILTFINNNWQNNPQ